MLIVGKVFVCYYNLLFIYGFFEKLIIDRFFKVMYYSMVISMFVCFFMVFVGFLMFGDKI